MQDASVQKPTPAVPEIDASRSQTKAIVIVGGGFAGTTLLQALEPRLPAGWELVLISEESYTTFNPMLPEVVGASIFPEQVVAPVRAMFRPARGARFLMGSVDSVDTQARRVTSMTLAGPVSLNYEHLVLCFGNRARLDLVPGMAEHALPLKTVGDAMHIRNVVLRRLAQIELESDPQRRRSLGHFVVIGGGFSGVEVAGELVDCLAGIRPYYPRVAADELQVSVLQDIDRLLPELPPELGRSAERSLAERGVHLRLGCRAAAVGADTVTLSSGEVLSAVTVISTIGTRPNPVLLAMGLPPAAIERGRLVTGPDMAVPAAPGVWALGDCAQVPNALDGQPCPPTAQFAVRQARHLATNLLAAIGGQPTQAFSHRSLGSMAAIGHRKGVARAMGMNLSGLPAWLLWRAYYLWLMPTWGRKLRIFVEWTWGMFFPADITHLRFTRSVDRQAGEAQPQTLGSKP